MSGILRAQVAQQFWRASAWHDDITQDDVRVGVPGEMHA